MPAKMGGKERWMLGSRERKLVPRELQDGSSVCRYATTLAFPPDPLVGVLQRLRGLAVDVHDCETTSTALRRQTEFLDSSPGTSETMNSFKKEEFDCHILAKDILDKKLTKFLPLMTRMLSMRGPGRLSKKHLRWLKVLPRVTPFYAVKSNDSRAIVNTLAPLGQVLTVQGGLKSTGRQSTSKAKLVLRIAPEDSKQFVTSALSLVQTSLGQAKELNIDVIGVSFHVGSGCPAPETTVQALSDARCVSGLGAEDGFGMYLLDSGDGFPGSEDTKLKFEGVTSVINPTLDKYFPRPWAHMKALLPKRPKPDEKYYSSSIWETNVLDRRALYLPDRHVADWGSVRTWVHTVSLLRLLSRGPEALYLLCNVEANVATHEADPELWLPIRSGGAGCWHSAYVYCTGEQDGPSPAACASASIN
ncbi:hypothetical protein U0070_014630, partial [Myodes glareolus]